MDRGAGGLVHERDGDREQEGERGGRERRERENALQHQPPHLLQQLCQPFLLLLPAPTSVLTPLTASKNCSLFSS